MPELPADSTMFLLSPTLHIALLPDCQTCQTATPSPPPPKTLLRTKRGSCAEVTALHRLSISSTVWSHSSSCKYEAFQIHLQTPTCPLHHCFRKTREAFLWFLSFSHNYIRSYSFRKFLFPKYHSGFAFLTELVYDVNTQASSQSTEQEISAICLVRSSCISKSRPTQSFPCFQ